MRRFNTRFSRPLWVSGAGAGDDDYLAKSASQVHMHPRAHADNSVAALAPLARFST